MEVQRQFGLGQRQSNGFTINVAASRAQGSGQGSDLTHTASSVSAGNTLTLESGRHTTLTGASASGQQVVANVGTSGVGDLTITSLQDQSSFTSAQRNAGFSVSLCIPPICYGASSGSASYGRANADGSYASVSDASGIKAGDGGFTVNVAGHTQLNGAVVASSQTAVDAGRNSLSTNTLGSRPPTTQCAKPDRWLE
jgi:filamentous hemagglutinin